MIVTQPLDELEMQDDVMKYDPATGEQRPYPSHAEQWRRWHGLGCAWLFDPWTGRRRNALDVGSDINGRLIVPAGTLGGEMNCGAQMQMQNTLDVGEWRDLIDKAACFEPVGRGREA